MREIDNMKVDRESLQVCELFEESAEEDLQYWLNKEPIERIAGIEVLRQSMYAYDPISERLPRFFEVIAQA